MHRNRFDKNTLIIPADTKKPKSANEMIEIAKQFFDATVNFMLARLSLQLADNEAGNLLDRYSQQQPSSMAIAYVIPTVMLSTLSELIKKQDDTFATLNALSEEFTNALQKSGNSNVDLKKLAEPIFESIVNQLRDTSGEATHAGFEKMYRDSAEKCKDKFVSQVRAILNPANSTSLNSESNNSIKPQ